MYIGPFLFVYILHVCLHPPLAMWQCFEKPLPVETLLPLDPTIWVIHMMPLAVLGELQLRLAKYYGDPKKTKLVSHISDFKIAGNSF